MFLSARTVPTKGVFRLVAGIAILVAFNGIAYCRDINAEERAVVNALTKGDAQLDFGKFSYIAHPVKVNEGAIPDFVKERNKDWKRELATDSSVTLEYDGEKYCHEFTKGTKNNPVTIRRVFDGADLFEQAAKKGESKEASLVVMPKEDLRDPGNRYLVPFPGPCGIQGRGLSSLRDVSVAKEGGEVVVRGVSPDRSGEASGWRLQALVDPAKGGLAKAIDRYHKDQLVNRITTARPIRLENGDWIASEALIESFAADGSVRQSTRYTLLKGSSARPSPSAFEIRLRDKAHVIDSRLGTPVSFTMDGGGLLSSQQLLEFTKQQVAKQAREKNEMADAAAKSKGRSRLQVMAIISVWVVLVGAFIAVRRRNRR